MAAERSHDALRSLPLACPIDGLALDASGRALVCGRGHAYDVSRFGYVNLLPVQFKPSKEPGDDVAMVDARRRVLDSGLFDPLADAVAERVLACLDAAALRREPPGGDEGRTPLLVDAGCGEGFHTARTASRIRADGRHGLHVLGADISVPAVKAAARRYRDVGWAVANNTRLPVLAGEPDVITSLFGFETWEPWSALQRVGQHVVVVHAGPRHLIELRRAVYETVRVHGPPSSEPAIAAGYVLEAERSLAFDAADVSAEGLADVLAMTPHAHRSGRGALASSPDRLHRKAPSGPLTLEAILRTYRKVR